MRPPIRVLLVDDSTLVRTGVKTALAASAEPRLQVVGEAETAAAAIAEAARLCPDVVLLDIRLPDGSGLESCRAITQRAPETKVIILTSFSNDNYVYEAISAGARGYLMKEINPEGLCQAVADVAAGKSILDPEATARVMRLVRTQASGGDTQELAALSPQETKVLALVAEGKTNKEIGDRLKLSDNTVKNYLGNVFDKLQVKRRSQAAALWVQAHPRT